MDPYIVAEAEAGLTDLIDHALAGDVVLVTRDGKPVAEIRPAAPAQPPIPPPPMTPEAKAAFHEWMAARRLQPKGPPITSVELLNLIYDELEP
jgi:antitoxin (DNA-binding transcriptional repressor) of toxin-antitoxin stability system